MDQASFKPWRSLSLTQQFLLAGGVVTLVGTLVVGWLVASLITSNVTRNAAATTALYVDSIIAPLLPDMQHGQVLTEGVALALDETLANGALGSRLLAFKLWDRNGVILYSKDHAEIGRKVNPSDELKDAWTGKVVAQFDEFDEHELKREGASGVPLLEIYNPILQPWSGEVVAVSEFYEVAENLERDLWTARLTAGAAVAGVSFAFFASLFAIVSKGSQTIDIQRSRLKERVDELTALLSANDALRQRVQGASQRTAALNESHLRRIGADLHDGPAQLVALAALRLDSEDIAGNAPPKVRKQAVAAVRTVIAEAMLEIRSISSGLVLPQVENAPIDEVILLAVGAHEQRTNTEVEFERLSQCVPALPVSAKICAYRFVQEGLNNAHKHAGGQGQRVRLRCSASRVLVEVIDKGTGFASDPDAVRLGLNGLRDRVESIGGQLRIVSSPLGTRLSMILARNHTGP